MMPGKPDRPQGESAVRDEHRRFPVALTAAFYAVLLALAVLWRWWADGAPVWVAPGPARPLALGLGVGLGLACGLALVAGSRWAAERTRSGRLLTERLAELVGPLSLPAVGLLALVSGVAEEAFFRGALQPRTGLWVATALFALAHYVPRSGMRSWSLFAAVAGLAFGWLFDWSGWLLAPALAHVVVNALNLRWLSRRALP
jgi:membrane protease YdiL (CAAX protease family)